MKTTKSISFALAAMLGITALSPATPLLATESSDPVTLTFFHYKNEWTDAFQDVFDQLEAEKGSRSYRKVPAQLFISETLQI